MPSNKLSKQRQRELQKAVADAEDTRSQLAAGLRALMEAAGKKVVSVAVKGDRVVYVIDEPEAGPQAYSAKIPPEHLKAMEEEDALRAK